VLLQRNDEFLNGGVPSVELVHYLFNAGHGAVHSDMPVAVIETRLVDFGAENFGKIFNVGVAQMVG